MPDGVEGMSMGWCTWGVVRSLRLVLAVWLTESHLTTTEVSRINRTSLWRVLQTLVLIDRHGPTPRS